MIDFNKNIKNKEERISSSRIVKTPRRISSAKKITKKNLYFLRSLGFKT